MFLDKIAAMPYALTAYLTLNSPVKILGAIDTGLSEDQITGLFTGDGAAAEGQPLDGAMNAVKNWGNGGVSILQVAFVFIAVAGIILGAAQMVIHSNKSQELSEDKKGMGWKIVAIVFGAAAVSFVIFLFGIGGSTSTTTNG